MCIRGLCRFLNTILVQLLSQSITQDLCSWGSHKLAVCCLSRCRLDQTGSYQFLPRLAGKGGGEGVMGL